MKEITYIFGAGASAGSMPLVSTFPARFRSFLQLLTNFENFSNYIKHGNRFLSDINAHLSFDTYFKKLYHQGEDDLINFDKQILTIYFLFEYYFSGKIDGNDVEEAPLSFCDPRYEALIAGLLQPRRNKREFFCKMNFITWNYDLNLAFALRNFLNPDASLHEIVSNHNGAIGSSLPFNNQAQLFHLNGFISDKTCSTLTYLTDEGLLGLLADLSSQLPDAPQKTYSSRLFENSKNIKFAWEWFDNPKDINWLWSNQSTSFEDSVHTLAKKAVERSSHVIIIGYSFPLYNRLIDAIILNSNSLSSTELTIQNPDAEDLSNVIVNDFQIQEMSYVGFGSVKINRIKSTNSFFVPNSVFSL